VEIADAIRVADLKRAAPRRSDQLSIEEVDVIVLADRIASAIPLARDMLGHYFQAWRPEDEHDEADKPTAEGSYVPGFADTRGRIYRSITLRRGQRAFRNKLVRRYGPFCMVTGCNLFDIVEAAHIWPYRGGADNNPENGILLRANLHTLFDLDLLGIEPETFTVHLQPLTRVAGYHELDGVGLRLHTRSRPSTEALNARWADFLQWRAPDLRKGPKPGDT